MIAILGGGISGLSVAYQLKKQGKNFVLIEKEQELGGKILSKQKDGFTLEMGPNTVLINNPEIKELLDDLGLSSEVIHPDRQAIKNRFVLYQNTLEPLPSSPLTMIKSPLIGWSSLKRFFKEPFLPKVSHEESLADFSRRRFGNEIYENFIYPFVTGIYAGDPERMSIHFTLKILKEAEEKSGSVIRGMFKLMKAKKRANQTNQIPKQKIFTFNNGLHGLIKEMEKPITDNILLGCSVDSIRKVDSKYVIKYQDDIGNTNEKTVEHVVSTLPAHILSQKIDFDNEVQAALKGINYTPAFVYHFGYKKEDIAIPAKAFGVLSRREEKVPFLGVLFNSQFFNHAAPAGHELITVISGGEKLKNLAEHSEEKRFELIRESIEKLFNVKGSPIMINSTTWLHGIPQYEMGHQTILDAIHAFEERHSHFYIQGNFLDGISVSDCISNGIKFAKQLA